MTADPSAAPVRERGLHSRAGNAMQRTRAAVLDGAVRAVEKHGVRKTTMADIAMLAGVAKGTLYNHFRTKEAVLAAAVDAGVRSLADECAAVAGDSLAEALSLAADRIRTHPSLRRVAAEEPAAVGVVSAVGDSTLWAAARDGVRGILAAAGRVGDDAAVELVLRWLVSFVGHPGGDVEAQAALLADALRARSAQLQGT
jgi:AcrR family transcriptional regulator